VRNLKKIKQYNQWLKWKIQGEGTVLQLWVP